MNILFVTHEVAFNGAVICLLNATRHLHKLGHKVTVFVDGPKVDPGSTLQPEFERAGATVIWQADGVRYDLAIVNTLLNFRWVRRFKGKFPVAWWIHEGTAVSKGFLAEAGFREALDAADHLIFPNPNADKMFAPLFGAIPPERRSIVTPAVPVHPRTSPANKVPGVFRVLCVGSLCPRKRQSDLLAAVAMLGDLSVECVLIGERSMVDEELAKGIEACGTRLVIAGNLTDAQVQSYYASADLVCLPSTDENMPAVPLEAGLHRVPILLSSLKCYEGIWTNGQNALIHPVGDRLLLATYIRALYGAPELRQRLGAAAEKTGQVYTEARFTAALDLAIEATVAAVRGGREERKSGFGWRLLLGGSGKQPETRAVPVPVTPAKPTAPPQSAPRVLPPPAPEIAEFHSRAMALMAAGDLPKAADLLRQALIQVPGDLRCLSTATMVQTFLKKHLQAEELALQAVERGPDVPALHVNLGNCLFGQGRMWEALQSFRRALDLNPDLTAALLNCGHCLARLDRADEAVDYYERALSAAGEEATVLVALGEAYLGLDMLDRAEHCLATVLEKHPDHQQARDHFDSLQQKRRQESLSETAPAIHPANDEETLRWQPGDRPHLVYVRAGPGSTHRAWFDESAPRSWDLLLDYYSVPEDGPDLRAEMVTRGGISKYPAIKAIWEEHGEALGRYQSVLFLDDDILCTMAGLNTLFGKFHRYGLEIAQAALTHESLGAWAVTYACPSFEVRFTNFVEIMMPLFSRKALKACIGSFDESVSGYGLDFVWPKMLAAPPEKVGIIDSVRFAHTKPVDFENGAFYKYLRSLGVDPHKEAQKVLKAHGIVAMKTKIFGAIPNSQVNSGATFLVPSVDAPPAAPAPSRAAEPARLVVQAGLRTLPPPAPEIAELHDRAMALAGNGDLANAANLLEQALDRIPGDVRSLATGTMVLTFFKDYRRAEDYGRRAVDLAPEIPALHVNLGNCLFGQGRAVEALSSFQRALGLQADLIPALLNCGHCHAALGQEEKAVEYFDAVLEKAPADSAALAVIGRAYIGLNRLADAEACLTRAGELDSGNGQIAADLAAVRERRAATEEKLDFSSPQGRKRQLVFSLAPGLDGAEC